MGKSSFSGILKEQLAAEEIRKKCCRHTAADIRSLSPKDSDDLGGELSAIYESCRCDGCRAVYLRYVFILFGSVTDPAKSYHLDIAFRTEKERNCVKGALAECGFDFSESVRTAAAGTTYLLYIKKSSDIEDFLLFIGAQTAAFELMNVKIEKEFKNSVNRQVNCDTANIEKQLASVKKYSEAINYLIETKAIDKLPAELKETALLRIENSQLSLSDLGGMMNPSVSKSGIKHRLDKILAFAEDNKSID